MTGAIRSSMWLMSLKKTEEMGKSTRETNGKLKPPQTPHWALRSPVDTAYGSAFPIYGSSIMSVPLDDVDRLPHSVAAVDADRIPNL